MSFWGELKRRNVFKVGAAYLIAAWLILQVASITFPALNLPVWAITLVTVFLIIGFIVALILAWAFELTPEGVKRSEDVPPDESITHVTGRNLNYVLAGLLIVAVGYIVIDKVFISQKPVETEMAPSVAEQTVPATEAEAIPKTIAVLPFDDLSPDKDQEYFVDGLTDEISNYLGQIPELKVTGMTSSFSFKGSNKTVQEITNILGVENLLVGSVRKVESALRITTKLFQGSDGSQLWSETYNRKLVDIFAVQKDIATAVANQLKVTLGVGNSLKQLGGTDNQEAYELYLIALGGLQEAQTIQDYINAFKRAQSSIDEAIELDSRFALAWSLKSRMHQANSMIGSPDSVDKEQGEAIRAANKAIELEPALPEGYAALGSIKQEMGEFIEASLAYDKVSELNPVSLANSDYTSLLENVAYFKKAHDFLEEALRVDPLNRDLRLTYLIFLGYFGDIEQVEKENERCMAIFGNNLEGNFALNIALLGSGHAVARDQIVIETFLAASKINGVAKEYLDSPKEALAVLRRLYNESENLGAADLNLIAFWAAYFGAPGFAMDIIEKTIGIEKGSIGNYWFPLFKEVRQLPRFKKLVREIGLVDYWNQFGWPDICRPMDNGDFVCD